MEAWHKKEWGLWSWFKTLFSRQKQPEKCKMKKQCSLQGGKNFVSNAKQKNAKNAIRDLHSKKICVLPGVCLITQQNKYVQNGTKRKKNGKMHLHILAPF